MKFQVTSKIKYKVFKPSTLIFNIHALRTTSQTILEENIVAEPHLRIEEFSSKHSENRFARIVVKEPMDFTISYSALVDSYYKIISSEELESIPVAQLDGDIIPFVFPSRYCQSDKIGKLAYDKFGSIDNIYSKVIAITEWIYKNVEYVSGSTNSTTSAYDIVVERAGVCRDFAHLAISLCRALSIPARYFTGYAFQLNPPDFHACFEAYIGGHWIIFDATKLVPLNGLVKIATGRDAADAAVSSIFGNVRSLSMEVSCNALEEFTPIFYDNSDVKAISFSS